jgi:succinate dehydrogenase/fumarate reductase cytochrome b subunit
MDAPPLTGHFVLRKLHSLTGIIPIGAFLAFHLFENSLAGGLVHLGREEWTRDVVMKIDGMPYVALLEIFVIALPLLFHGIYGAIIWLEGRANPLRYGYARNWMYLVQRISGVVAFVFILTHVWETRLQVLFGHTGALREDGRGVQRRRRHDLVRRRHPRGDRPPEQRALVGRDHLGGHDRPARPEDLDRRVRHHRRAPARARRPGDVRLPRHRDRGPDEPALSAKGTRWQR